MMATPTTDFYPIVGIQDGLDTNKANPVRKVHVRMEIDEWFTSQKFVHLNQRALFFPAFLRFSQMDPHDKLSYFQIAGIHGKPFISWDEEPQKGATDNRGYCTHNSILFATWHRPYLLLFEQVIYELMKDEVAKYDKRDQADLQKALESWRFPYWDWALKKQVPTEKYGVRDYTVPLVMLQKEVTVRQPTLLGYGNVPNAFHQFTMPKGIIMGDETLKNKDPLLDLSIVPSEVKDGEGKSYKVPFDKCTATSRHPTWDGKVLINDDWVKGKQDNTAIEKDLRDYKWDPVGNTEDSYFGNLTASLRDAFYRLTTIKRWEDFATKRAPWKDPKNPYPYKKLAFDSCENLHDNMHGWCGGDWTKPDGDSQLLMGHMSHVPLAAFDPIFWIHHCNVDRLIAIWQMIHDDSWFDDSDDRNRDAGTFAIKPDTVDRPGDDLRPFHNGEGKYWTSTQAREVTALGYTYPGLEKWEYTNPDGTWDKVRHLRNLIWQLNIHYNSSWAAAEKAEITADPGQEGPRLMSLNTLQATANRAPVDLVVDDYVVDVVYEKFALNGSKFIIHIFVGKVPDTLPYTFQDPGTQVGQIVNFSSEPDNLGNTPDGCQNCKAQQIDRAEATGKVVLTNALITRWKNQVPHEPEGEGPHTLASMKPDDVVKFLRANLHWRVTCLGEQVDIRNIPSLKVSVAVGKANHYADRTKLSEFYDYKPAYEITQGRPGGIAPEDGMYPPGWEYRVGQPSD